MEKLVLRRLAGVFTLYVGLTLVMSWPAAAVLDSHIIGKGGDPWQTLWRFEDTEQKLREGGLLFVIHELAGQGEPRLVNLSVWPWLWLHLLAGQPLAYNLIWLLGYVLAGLGMYLLVRWLLQEFGIKHVEFRSPNHESRITHHVVTEGPALLAGLMYMFLPFHVAHSFGHFGAMQIQWLPFLLWAGMACAVRPRVWKAGVAAVLFALQAWTEHHYALWFVLFVAMAALWQWRALRARWRVMFVPAIVFAAGVLVLAVVPYRPTVSLALQPGAPLDLGDAQLTRFSADPFSYAVPAPFHPLAGGLSRTLFHQYFTGNAAEATHYIGLVSLLLVLFFTARLPVRARRLWVATAVVFFLISLGPWLHVLGQQLPVPLPYALIANWPIISSVRAVARASVMVGVAGSVLFGLTVAFQVRRAANIILLGGVLLLEFLFVPVPAQSAAVPAAYARLRERPGARVIELPAATNYDAASRALHGSLLHGKEVVGNFALERAEGAAALNEARSLPMLRQLLYLRTTHLLEGREELFAQEAAETFADVVRYLDARTVIVHVDSLSAVQVQAARQFFEEQLGVRPEEVDDVLLYALDELPAGDGVFAARDARWQQVGYDPARDSVFAEVASEATLTLYNVRSLPTAVQLQWETPTADAGDLALSAAVPVAEVGGGTASQRTFRLLLPPGKTAVVFSHTGGGTSVLQNPRLEVIP